MAQWEAWPPAVPDPLEVHCFSFLPGDSDAKNNALKTACYMCKQSIWTFDCCEYNKTLYVHKYIALLSS